MFLRLVHTGPIALNIIGLFFCKVTTSRSVCAIWWLSHLNLTVTRVLAVLQDGMQHPMMLLWIISAMIVC
jgi:hypothetical protein